MAAALVPIYEEGGLARVVLIRRSPAVPVHAGEVSFPGGRVQPGEREVAAALREAHEEVGLDPAAVEVVARLPTVTGVTSGTTVAPFVGLVAGGRPGLRAEPAEVDAVLDVALADLLAPGSGWEERWDGPGGDRPMWFFRLDGDVVWGMTARVLHHLLGLVTGRTAPPPPAPPLAPAGTTPPAPA
jgi:8-oxo-dGTP pyrophosphatase MutT (NUDIX family)